MHETGCQSPRKVGTRLVPKAGRILSSTNDTHDGWNHIDVASRRGQRHYSLQILRLQT